MPRPRIALVGYRIEYRYAVPRILAEMIRRLHDQVELVVVSDHLDEELRPLVDWRPVRDRRTSARMRSVSFFLAAAPVIHRAGADLVHSTLALVPNRVDLAWVQWSYAGFHRATAALPARERPVTFAAARAVSTAIERWCFGHRTRMLAAASTGGKRELETLFPGVPATVVPNGVDTERFRPNPELRESTRAERGVGPDEFVAVFVGSYAQVRDRKGLGPAIEGLAAARARGGRSDRLWVLGSGDERIFRELARRHGVESRVEFLGYREDTERYYAAADVFLLPTLYETFCLAAYEAAASGLPVVVTQTNGIDELVDGGSAGIAVGRDPDDLASALVRLSADRPLREAMGNAARRRAVAYSWDRSAETLLGTYERLLGRAA